LIRTVTYDCWRTLLRDKAGSAALERRAHAVAEVTGLPEDRAAAVLRDAFAEHDAAWRRIEAYTSRSMARYCIERAGRGHERLDELIMALEEATLGTGVEAIETPSPSSGAAA
jgi:hypothetical protein